MADSEDKVSLVIETINDNEWRPDVKDRRWKKHKKDNIHTIEKDMAPDLIHYVITKDLLKKMKKYVKVFEDLDEEDKHNTIVKFNDNVAKILLVTSTKTDKIYVTYTTNSIMLLIKLALYNYFIGRKSLLDNFEGEALTNLSFELIEILKYGSKGDIIRRKNYWEEKYIPKEDTKDNENNEKSEKKKGNNNINDINNKDKISVEIEGDFESYDIIMKIHDRIIKPYRRYIKSLKVYIYRLTNMTNNKKLIFGTIRRLDNPKFKKFLQKADQEEIVKEFKKNNTKNLQLDLIEKYYADSFVDYHLRIDYHIDNYDTIHNGYNDKFLLKESRYLKNKTTLNQKALEIIEKNIFLRIQAQIAKNVLQNLDNKEDYSDMIGYIFMINNKKNDKKYIGRVNNTNNSLLSDNIASLYGKAITNNEPLSEVLANVPFKQLNIKILKRVKKNDIKTNLGKELIKHIKKYDSIKNGYNTEKSIQKLSKQIVYKSRY